VRKIREGGTRGKKKGIIDVGAEEYRSENEEKSKGGN